LPILGFRFAVFEFPISIFQFRFSLFDFQFSIFNFRFSIFGLRFWIFDSGFRIRGDALGARASGPPGSSYLDTAGILPALSYAFWILDFGLSISQFRFWIRDFELRIRQRSSAPPADIISAEFNQS
jgi:hypothetical protein